MTVHCNKLSKQQRILLRSIIDNPCDVSFVGSGATAEVLAFDQENVLRLQKVKEDYNPEVYLNWALFCLKTRSKHVPKIKYLEARYNQAGTLVEVISVLERLISVDYDKRFEGCAYVVEGFFRGYYDWKEMELPEDVVRAFNKKAATRLKEKVRSSGLRFNDLHDGNWMLRGSDGRLVITDPIV